MHWICSAAKGSFGDSYWPLAILLGEYSPVGTATGIATVALYAPFAINASTGEITITDASGLAVGQTWALTVRATDALDDTDDATITIELTSGGIQYHISKINSIPILSIGKINSRLLSGVKRVMGVNVQTT